MASCYFCGKNIELEDKIFRKDECPHCAHELHCCLQCRFYEPGKNNDCAEPRAERVVVKDRANFCDYFEFGENVAIATESADAKKKLADLFKI